MHVHVLHAFTRASAVSAASSAPTHPSLREAALCAASTTGVGRLRRPPPIVDSFVEIAFHVSGQTELAFLDSRRSHPTPTSNHVIKICFIAF